MNPSTKKVPCFCGRACVYHLLRCDVCHRGVHFACIKMTLAEASAMTVYICRTCQDTSQEDALVDRLAAEGRPGAVVFTTICHQHNPKTGHRRGTSTTSALARGTETLSKDRCHICHKRCNFELIQCDGCEAWCHYACEKMTPELAEHIDKWYCRRCLKKDPTLHITYAQDGEDSMPPQPNNFPRGVRHPKRRFKPVEKDHLEKKPRLDGNHTAKIGEDQRPADEEQHLDLREEKEKLLLDLEDEDELYLDLEDEPWSWA